MNHFSPVIVFSAWRALASESENRAAVEYVKSALDSRGIEYKSAQGCYKGQTEPAIVVIDTENTREVAQNFARLFKQESLLFVDANRAARLETPDGELLETLGRLRAVPEHVAKGRDAWTRVDDQFYITTAQLLAGK